jgi:hypothetical protein
VNAEKFCEQSIEHFRRIDVNERYTTRIKELVEKIKMDGMVQSDVIVIIGIF